MVKFRNIVKHVFIYLTTVTNYDKVSDLKHQKFIFLQFCKLKVQKQAHWAKTKDSYMTLTYDSYISRISRRKSVLYFSTASTPQLSALSQSLFQWSHLLFFLSLLSLSLPFLYKANFNDILGPSGNPRYNLLISRCLNISAKRLFTV